MMFDFSVWINALRLKTLPASIIPTLFGAGLSFHFHHRYSLFLLLLTLFCSVGMQILSNFINEIYDFRKGADNKRIGPERMVASGKISIKDMAYASAVLTLMVLLIGSYLSWLTSPYIFIIGLESTASAFFYTGGPYPLAYKGLGEVFVIFFFGIIATSGSFFIQSGTIDLWVVTSGIIPGLLSSNILSVNNVRDRESDLIVNKKTLAVMLGDAWGRRIIYIQTIITFAIAVVLGLQADLSWAITLICPAMVYAFIALQSMTKRHNEELNQSLADFSILLIVFMVSFYCALIL